MTRLLLLLIVLAVPSFAWAEDLYVAQDAAGSADGSSCANAFNNIFFNTPGNWTPVVPTTNKINPGDTVHLCGIITVQLTAQLSGTSGIPITIRWETGARLRQPKCPGGINSTTLGCLVISNLSWIIIDGGSIANGIIESTEQGTYPTYPQHVSEVIGLNANNCTNCEIKNLTIQNMYVHLFDQNDHCPGEFPTGTFWPGHDECLTSYDRNVGLSFSGKHVKIHDIYLKEIGWAIKHNTSTAVLDNDIELYNLEFYHTSHGITTGTTCTGCSDFRYHHMNYHDPDNWDTNVNQYHHDGMHFFGNATSNPTQSVTGIQIYDSLFGPGCGTHFTAHIFLEAKPTTPTPDSSWNTPGNGSLLIYNNVFRCDTAVNGMLQIGMGANVQVYNNTIMGKGALDGVDYGDTCFVVGTVTKQVTNFQFKNNAIAGCRFLVGMTSVTFPNGAAQDFNFNTYGSCGSVSCYTYSTSGTPPGPGPTFLNTFALWKTACGCDANSQKITPTKLAVNASGILQSGSLLTNASTNLTGLGITALNLDKTGIERFDIGAWTTGAYNLDIPLITNFSVLTEPTLPVMGPKNYKIVDPIFGTTILRVTDATDGPFGRSLYSAYPSFNVNSTRVMGLVSSGFDRPAFWNFNATTFKVSNKQVPTTPNFGYATRWSGTNPDEVYSNGGASGNILQKYNIATNTLTTLRDFTANIPATYQVAQMQQDLADNIFGMNITLAGVPKGYILWRRSDNTILLNVMDANNNETYVDKTGRYFYRIDNFCSAHVYDLISGSAVFVATVTGINGFCHNGQGTGTVFASQQSAMNIRSLATPTVYTKLMDGYFGTATVSHHQSFNATDESYALVSRVTNQPGDGLVHAAFDNELLQVATSGNAVRRIAHHRSLTGPTQGGDYDDTPFANISPDGKFVAFTSNWGNSLGSNRDDLFLVQVTPPVSTSDTTPPASPTNIRVQ